MARIYRIHRMCDIPTGTSRRITSTLILDSSSEHEECFNEVAPAAQQLVVQLLIPSWMVLTFEIELAQLP